MADGVRFESIEIVSSPGIPRSEGFGLRGLAGGIAIIHGPNGIGKSTTARAAADLLWGGVPSPGTEYAGELLRDGERWRVEFNPTGRYFFREGQPAPDPEWARADTRARHTWSLKDLMDSEDEDLARKVAAALRGGVDLDEAARALGWAELPASPRKLAAEVTEAARKVREVRGEQQDLLRRAEETRALEEEAEQFQKTAARRPRVEAAIHHLRLREQLAEIRARLETAPPAMRELRSDDAESLQRKQETLESLERDIARLGDELGALPSPHPGFSGADNDTLDALLHDIPEQLRTLSSLEQHATTRRESVAALEAKEENLRERLGLDPGAMRTGHGTPELRDYIDARLRADAARARAEESGPRPDAPPKTSETELLSAKEEVRRMLRAPHAANPFFWFVIISMVALTVYLLWMRVNIWWAVMLQLFVLLTSFFSSSRFVRSREFRARWPESLPFPASLKSNVLEETLDQLEALRRAHHAWQDHAKADELDAAAKALIPSLDGVHPKPDPRWAAHFLTDLQTYRELLTEADAAKRLARDAEAEVASRRKDILTRLETWMDRPGDGDPEAIWSTLRGAVRKERDLRDQRRELEQKREHLRQRLAETLPERDALLARLQLESPDIAEVQRRVTLLEDWRRDFRDSETLSLRLSELRNELSDDPELLETAAPELERMLAECDEAGKRAEELRERITRLDQDVRRARRGNDLHEALERLEQAREKLAEERDRALEVGTGKVLLDWLREQTLKHDAPRVLESANQLLARITGGELQLGFAREAGRETFRAGRPGHSSRPLDQLSSGERAQVLMSVRLAFLDHSDIDGKLPLFVDEALGSSDDDRARRIMAALIASARGGRQIFYFTAQLDEVAKWTSALSEQEVPWKVVDLAQVRGKAVIENRPLPRQTAEPVSVPRPQPGESPEDWARRVGIPAPDPRAPVEDVHLWHVVRDPEKTAKWMERGLTRWGNLRILVESGALDVEGETVRGWRVRAAGLAARHAAWHRGRPRPITAGDLVASGAVSETFLDGMAGLLEEVQGDASALLAALDAGKLARWRQNKTEELREWLESNGLLPDQPPLDEEAIRAHELAAMEREEG